MGMSLFDMVLSISGEALDAPSSWSFLFAMSRLLVRPASPGHNPMFRFDASLNFVPYTRQFLVPANSMVYTFLSR